MKETIEKLAQSVGFDIAGLITQQFKEKYEKKKYAGCINTDYFGYTNKRSAFFARYASRHLSDINTNIIPPLTNQAFETFDDEWETQRWRW